MAFHIRNTGAEQALRELCELTGESLTEAIQKALTMRLESERAKLTREKRSGEMIRYYEEMRRRVSKLPILDHRSDDEILGYDEHGLPSRTTP